MVCPDIKSFVTAKTATFVISVVQLEVIMLVHPCLCQLHRGTYMYLYDHFVCSFFSPCLQGTIQALQVLRGERDQRERVLEKEQRKQAVLDGENPDEVLLRKKRAKEFSKKKAEFEENRKQNHLEIVAKLLDEQKLKKRTEILASKSHWKGRWPLDGARQSDEVRQNEHVRKRKNKFQQRNTVHSPLGGDGDNPLIGANQTGKEEGGGNLESSDEEVHVHVGLMRECDIASSDFDETLTKPEIDGLWSQEARGKPVHV